MKQSRFRAAGLLLGEHDFKSFTLMGTLLEVGMGKRTPESMEEILAARDREQAGPLMPAKGLVLVEVYF